MKCEKCGKEIPEGENKLCDDCKKALLNDIESDTGKISENKNATKEKKQFSKSNSKNKLGLLIIVFVIIVAVILGVCFIKNNSSISEGNTISNIRNYGYTVKKGSWVYYVAPSEDGKKVAIYKSKLNGDKKQTLLVEDWDILGLNVKDNYLYFIAIDNSEVESNSDLNSNESKDELNNKIYRMKLNGEDLQVINNNGFHNNCYEIYVVKDKVYYIGVDQNIYSMNLDGSEVTRVNDDETGYLGITDDYIILNIAKTVEQTTTENINNETKEELVGTGEDTTESTGVVTYETYIMNLDGSNKHSLTGERLYSINVVGDYIYYVNDNKQIYKVKVDGTDNTLVSDQVTAYNMNTSDKYIYYMNYVDNSSDKIAIFRMNFDGSDNKAIYEFDNYSTFLNVVDDKVVFMDNNDSAGSINLIDSNGENRVKLYELTYEDYLNYSTTDDSNANTTVEELPEESNTDETAETEENVEESTEE